MDWVLVMGLVVVGPCRQQQPGLIQQQSSVSRSIVPNPLSVIDRELRYGQHSILSHLQIFN